MRGGAGLQRSLPLRAASHLPRGIVRSLTYTLAPVARLASGDDCAGPDKADAPRAMG